jgi:16S rRNA (adenine1518-N6/adenine1519-N6)-dimethyltransferase
MDHIPLRTLVTQFNLEPTKKLGQNFLFDQNLTDKIALKAGDLSNCTVIEIGPGPGGLTRSLLRVGAKKIIAVEYDPRCVKALESLVEASEGKLTVLHEDAMKLKLDELCEAPRKIVANLPYNIGTVLLVNWLDYATAFERMILMFQKEVADRLTAVPNTKDYGKLSVLVQWRCAVRTCFDVPKEAFTPPPKVTSSVVELNPYPEPKYPANIEALERVLEKSFNQRRKMLRASLKPLFDDVETVLDSLGIAPTRRPETLTVEEFCKIANAL